MSKPRSRALAGASLCTWSVAGRKDPGSWGLGLLPHHGGRAGSPQQRLCGSAKLKALSGLLRKSLPSPVLCEARELYPAEPSCADKARRSPGRGMVSNQTAMMQSERGDSWAQSPQEGRWDQERLSQGAEPPHCRAPQLGKRTEAQRQGEPPESIPCHLCPPGAAFSYGSVPDSGAPAITSGSWDTIQPTTDPFYSVPWATSMHPFFQKIQELQADLSTATSPLVRPLSSWPTISSLLGVSSGSQAPVQHPIAPGIPSSPP